jgi:hypothetical protein
MALTGTVCSDTTKKKTIRNEIQLDGINQFSTPVLTDNPETNYSANGSFTKKTYHFSLRLNTRLSWFNYSQTLNSVTTTNERTSQNVGLLFKTAYRKWPVLVTIKGTVSFQESQNQISKRMP